jgi:hypothetical protein
MNGSFMTLLCTVEEPSNNKKTNEESKEKPYNAWSNQTSLLSRSLAMNMANESKIETAKEVKISISHIIDIFTIQ